MKAKSKHASIRSQFIAHRLDMLESPAFWALSHVASRMLTRIEIEHCGHGGQDNGKLPVTYDDWERCGLRRKSLSAGLAELVAFGFVEVTSRGRAAAADFRTASTYRLTYLPTRNAAPTDEWARLDEAAVARIEAELHAPRKAAPGQDIDSRGISAPMHVGAKTPPRIASRSGGNAPKAGAKTPPANFSEEAA